MSFNCAVVTFIYPSVEQYLQELILSLNAQSRQNFRLIIFNDGVESKSLENFLDILKIEVKVINVCGSPIEIRYDALKYLKTTDYEGFIFQDSDDAMGIKRVEKCSEALINWSLVVNDLTTIDAESKILFENIWADRFKHEFEFSIAEIKDFNFAGFTNTSIRKNLLDFLPDSLCLEITAVDWYVFSFLLKNSAKSGVFLPETTTYYRQHDSNLIGAGVNFKSEQQISFEKKVILQQKNSLGLKANIDSKRNIAIAEAKSVISKFWWEQ